MLNFPRNYEAEKYSFISMVHMLPSFSIATTASPASLAGTFVSNSMVEQICVNS